MEKRVDAISNKQADEQVWLLEYPPLFTAGSSASQEERSETLPFHLYRTGRGGRVTYHGPGQRIVYLMLDLNRRERDIRHFIYQIEQWIIDVLDDLGVPGLRFPPHTGVWVNVKGEEKKIAAIGLRLRRWVSYHGISINVNPDLSHYAAISPCGIRDKGLTSLHQLHNKASMSQLDDTLYTHFLKRFGNVQSRDDVSGE